MKEADIGGNVTGVGSISQNKAENIRIVLCFVCACADFS